MGCYDKSKQKMEKLQLDYVELLNLMVTVALGQNMLGWLDGRAVVLDSPQPSRHVPPFRLFREN